MPSMTSTVFRHTSLLYSVLYILRALTYMSEANLRRLSSGLTLC